MAKKVKLEFFGLDTEPSFWYRNSFYAIKNGGKVDCYITTKNNVPIPITTEDAVHNNLKQIQGGEIETGEFYHLTLEQLNSLKALIENVNEESKTHEFLVTKGAGNLNNGDTFPQGLTLGQAFQALLTGTYEPTLVIPTYLLSENSGVRESGETINLVLKSDFNRGDIKGKIVGSIWQPNTSQNYRAGSPSKHVIDGTTYVTTNNMQNKEIPSYKVLKGSNMFNSSVSYTVGPQPLDSNGDNFSTPLPAGALSSTISFNGFMRTFAGSVSVLPTTPAQLRSSLIATSVLNSGNSLTFKSGTVNRMFVIAIPAIKTLIEVKNGGTNEVLTFSLSSLSTVTDAGGDIQPYKVYTLINAIPFSSNYDINIKTI